MSHKVQVETIMAGDGRLFPKKGQTVAVHYVGKLRGAPSPRAAPQSLLDDDRSEKTASAPRLRSADPAVVCADGTIFDTTYKRNRPLKFKLGCQQVVPGWDEGVSQLSLGEMATIRMPAAKAWGATGIPGLIPPNEDLEFEVELQAVQ